MRLKIELESTATILCAARIRAMLCAVLALAASLRAEPDLRIGIIGTDTSHTVVLSRIFNDPAAPDHVPGARIVCAYPGGSTDIPLSANRVAGFAREAQAQFGVITVNSIAEVMARSDAVVILSLDGRIHLAQAKLAFPAGKPIFVDKPLAGSVADAVEIIRLARRDHTPLFSASSMRFSTAMVALKARQVGTIMGAISYGPSPIEAHVPDLAYYGIHAVDALFAVLGPSCESLSCLHTEDSDVVSGRWSGGRTGVVYGLRNVARGYNVTVFGTKAIASGGQSSAYQELALQLVQFFRTKRSPVSDREMLEVIAFIQAAEQSKHQAGSPVSVVGLIPEDLRKRL
jgi:predicted dehydrogenase